ncbi:MAG: immunoglobulin domain-containing protein [Limisphaerales bacterium]
MKLNQQPRWRFNLAWASLTALGLTLAAPSYSQSADSFNPGANSNVWALAVQTNGYVLVGGDFTTVATQGTNYLARLNPTGTDDTRFGGTADGEILCIAVQPDGKILVGGSFDTLAGVACTNIGRLNMNGSFDTNFVAGANGAVQCLAVQADGSILCAGAFTSLNGQPYASLGRLLANGVLDANFAPNPDQAVNALAVQPDGKILVGGDFSVLAGQSSPWLGRITSDGFPDASFTSSANAAVTTLAVQADGKILVGGSFTTLDGLPWRNLGRLNADGSLDTSFNPNPDSPPTSLVLQADGSIVVGGSFRNLGGMSCRYIGRLTTTGVLDTSFLPGANAPVGALAIQNDGKILVGGTFSVLAGQPRTFLGRLTNTNTPTQSLSSDGSSITWLRGGGNPEVWRTTFEVSPDGLNWTNLGAGARTVGGWILTNVAVPPKSMLRARGFVPGGLFNGSGWFVESDSASPVLVKSPVSSTNLAGTSVAFSVQASGTPVLSYTWRRTTIKGTFTLTDGGNVSGSATATLSLTNLSGLDSGAYTALISSPFGAVTSAVATLTVLDPYISKQPVGSTNVAGSPASFSVSAAGASPITYQWLKNGTNLVQGTNLSGVTSSTMTVKSVLGGDAGAYTVLVTDPYGQVLSTAANLVVVDPVITNQPVSLQVNAGQLAVFNVGVAGTAPIAYQWRQNGTNIVGATMAALSIPSPQRTDIGNYDVVVTNHFGKTTSSLASLTVNLVLVDSWNPGADNSVSAIIQQSDGKLLVGGDFGSVSGQPRLGLARLNTDGSLDGSFNPGADNSVSALALQTDDKTLVGGQFANLAGQPCGFLGRLNTDATLDSTFTPALNGRVLSLSIQPDGKILVGGEFTTVGGQPYPYLARLNSDGTLDTAFAPAPDNAVLALAVQPDGKVLVGGVFTGLGGQSCSYIGRLNTDGTLDSSFTSSANSWVYSLALQPDGNILAGGVFTVLDGQTRWCIGRLKTDGSLDATFNPNAHVSLSPYLVYCVGLQADGKVLVGGNFTTLGPETRRYLGRLNPDGSLDDTFNPGADGQVSVLALQSDGSVVAGGSFATLGGQPRSQVGRLLPTDPAINFLSFDGSTITWQRGGTSPEVWLPTFQTYIDGTGWIDLGAVQRITNGWQLTGLGLDPSALILAQGYVAGSGPSCWFVEQSLPLIPLSPPTILRDASFGFQSNQFGFNVSGTVGQNVLVETSTNLVNWTSLTNFTLGSGLFFFSDPNASGYPVRFYRATGQ